MKLNEIHIRDPFVLPYEGKYYLYGTPGEYAWRGADGFYCYTSDDLENWEGPQKVFEPDASFWSDRNYWAPEVHIYKGAFYIFATFYAENKMRSVQVLRSESPLGPFEVWSDILTPDDWMSLDGTPYIDGDGQPWMFFCHEWTQIGIGTMCVVKLSEDLKKALGEPITLFSATDAKWVIPFDNEKVGKAAITDGPWIEKEGSKLVMYWSSTSKSGYTVGKAVSSSGSVTGPWEQEDEPVMAENGGHCMVFEAFNGDRYFSLHRPNKTPEERPVFIKKQQI